MNSDRLRITYLTAGAAGMFCGSCLHDNALAKALIAEGHEALLVPVYTPIRTDDVDVSIDQVFLGGINVYLQQKLPWLKYLPTWFDRFLNNPSFIAKATKDAGKTSPKLLGELSVSMLRGLQGRQSKEFARLIHWLKTDVRPDVVVFTNLLIGGFIPDLKKETNAKVVVTLQGDDIFLESLPNRYRDQALQLMRSLVHQVDSFVLHSEQYATQMKELLQIPDSKLTIIPLGIPAKDFIATKDFTESSEGVPGPRSLPATPAKIRTLESTVNKESTVEPVRRYTVGYLARMAPEKGLHRLIDAFIRIANKPGLEHTKLKMAGWMGPQHQAFWEEQRQKLADANLNDRWEYVGSIDRQEKAEFLKSIDLFCVPTVYQEPKGLFLLEAVAAGVPYLQPRHGAFTELHARFSNHASNYQHGFLFEPSRNLSESNNSDSETSSLFIPTSAPAGQLEQQLERCIQQNISRYQVPAELLEEIDISKHADRFLELIRQLLNASLRN